MKHELNRIIYLLEHNYSDCYCTGNKFNDFYHIFDNERIVLYHQLCKCSMICNIGESVQGTREIRMENLTSNK